MRSDMMAFTQVASSDLQDTLHVAHGFAARLAEKYSAVLDDQGRHYVSRIQASIGQLAKLIDDLRTLAQVSLRGTAPEAMDLAPICQALIAGLRKRDPSRNVTIEMAASLPLVASRVLLTTVRALTRPISTSFSRRSSACIRPPIFRVMAWGWPSSSAWRNCTAARPGRKVKNRLAPVFSCVFRKSPPTRPRPEPLARQACDAGQPWLGCLAAPLDLQAKLDEIPPP